MTQADKKVEKKWVEGLTMSAGIFLSATKQAAEIKNPLTLELLK